MVKTVFFILPPDITMPSTHVRGFCLNGFAPLNYKFVYVYPKISKTNTNSIKTIFNFLRYALLIYKIKSDKKNDLLYFIKPSSVLLLALCRFVYKYKIFIDVNDPLHLREHLGRFSKLKFICMANISNGVVYESLEYENHTRKWHKNLKTIIEDTPQFEISYINYSRRANNVVWFGSPATSNLLINYIDFLIKFNQAGFGIILLGADKKVQEVLQRNSVEFNSIDKYDHEILLEELSKNLLSFVPMQNIEAYSLRGNLKAKFSMASGCITIASDLEMHTRLIDQNETGFVFKNFNDFSNILDYISKSDNKKLIETIGFLANQKIMNKFNRSNHARKICKFFETADQ